MKHFLVLMLFCLAQLSYAQSLPTTTNYMPMDGPWKQVNDAPASGVGVTLNSTTKFLQFPSTTTGIYVKNTDGTAVKGIPTTMAGKMMVFMARGTNGARIRISFKNSSYTSTLVTPYLTDGGIHKFIAPSERYVVTEAVSGTGDVSTVRGYLFEDHSPEIIYGNATGKVQEPLSISPNTLNDKGYAVTSCTTSPALPAGFTINNTNCMINGTPTAVQPPTSYVVKVSNSQGSSVGTLDLEFGPNSPVLSYSGATGVNGKVNFAMSVLPVVLDYRGADVTSCTSSPALPAGLTIHSTTCVISGTPTESISSKEYLITATNSAGSGTANVTLSVEAEYGTYEKPFNRVSSWNIKPVNPIFGTNVIPTDRYFPVIGGGAYSTGIFKASASDGPMTVYPRGSNIGVWDPAAEEWLPTVKIPHWPSDVEAATGTDGHADIYDPTTGLLHSFWILRYNTTSLRWEAQQWSASPLTGTGWGTPGMYMTGARAAGVPTAGGLIRKHEINDGKEMYEHALAMTMAHKGLSANPTYIYPATSADSDAQWTNTGFFPEGALMMLPPSFDESTITKTFLKKVVRTLKTYGARVVDRNTETPYHIMVENGASWPGHRDANGNYVWDNVYATELHRIRQALRMVVSADSWTDRTGSPVTTNEDGRGINLLALRGPWKLNGTTVRYLYDSAKDEMVFGPTTTAKTYVNSDGTGFNKVPWGTITGGNRYKVTVKSTNGAKINFEFRGTNYTLLYTTGYLTDGQTMEFTAPNSGLVIYARTGENVSSSSLKVYLEKL